MTTSHLLLCVVASVLLTSGGCHAQEAIPIRLSQPIHSAEVRELGDGVYEVRTTGDDPYVLAEELTQTFDPERLQVFSFEYQCPSGLDFFEVFFIAPKSGWVNHASGKIDPTTDWQPFAVNVKAIRSDEWDGAIRQFRIDFGGGAGKTVRVRNIQLRAMTPDEARAAEERLAQERRRLAQLAAHVEKALIAPAGIADMTDMIAATHSLAADGNVTGIAVVGRELDLATQLREYAGEVTPPVSLPPAIVVGEGDSPKNHTVVRLLNRHGICEVQFLAYAPSVRGGVQVVTGTSPDGSPCVITAPLRDEAVREIRLFNRHGNRLGSIDVPQESAPPFSIAAGDFVAGSPAGEVAVCPAALEGASFPIAVFSMTGERLRTVEVTLPRPLYTRVTLSTYTSAEGDRIIAHAAGDEGFCLVDAEKGDVRRREAEAAADCTGVYQSAFAGAPYAGVVRETLFSSLDRIPAQGKPQRLNVGERENLFWFSAAGAYEDVPEGIYTRHSLFSHRRTDFSSPHVTDPDFTRTDPAYWAGGSCEEYVEASLAKYDTNPPVCWEPCFTHRWFAGLAVKWAEARDEETGLPKYTVVDRENEAGYYGEFGATKSFVSGSYAPGLKAVDCMYVYPQRAFLHGLIERFRRNPENFVAVEPNHEMEINAESSTTHGDYNPAMIRAFYRYLMSLYGSLDNVNRVFGTSFSADRFDAPRDLQRGAWDAYSTDNPYYMVWMRFMNYVIYRILAGTYREALLAGFPPEAIKCHQIPDHYAIASLTAFSKPARRITPIDWNLNAGVGYGFTRYGVWFNREHNCTQGAHSSGFDATVIGEYQSLTPDADAAYRQLAYMRDHGVQFIHCMNWPKGHDRGFNKALAEALRRLVEEDAPRPGMTGGTGQVRAVVRGEDAYDIVSIGTQQTNTGLLKSIRADGSWEGSVYVAPFHAHVAVEPLVERAEAELSDRPLSVGPFEAIDAGNLIELSFRARTDDEGGHISFRVYHHEVELAGARVVMPVGPEWRHYRCLVRVQIDTDDLRIGMGSGNVGAGAWPAGSVMLRDLSIIRHREMTTKLKKGIFAGERHEGGVTFDIISEGA